MFEVKTVTYTDLIPGTILTQAASLFSTTDLKITE